jgi:sphingomyelin phosphodiesterase acid-like 3
MFLSSEKLANELVEYDDVIELAVFAHTHMDGLRFLKDGGQSAVSGKGIAVKMVPSISPINGNHPSITLAQVDPSSAALKDYKVFAASNSTGVEDSWAEEYDFASNFHKAAFSSSSVHQLIDGFASDPDAKTEASQHYAHNFFVGDLSPVLVAFWPQYVCTLSNDTEQTYRACVCSTEQ